MDLKPEDVERWALEAGLIEPGWHSVPAGKLPALYAIAYAAGRAAGLEEAAQICDSSHYAEVAGAEIRRLIADPLRAAPR